MYLQMTCLLTPAKPEYKKDEGEKMINSNDFTKGIKPGMTEAERETVICENFRDSIKEKKGGDIYRHLSKCYIKPGSWTYHLEFVFPIPAHEVNAFSSDVEVNDRDISG